MFARRTTSRRTETFSSSEEVSVPSVPDAEKMSERDSSERIPQRRRRSESGMCSIPEVL